MTRKDIRMDWEQIEVKWHEMARRVRTDLAPARSEPAQPALGLTGRDSKAATVIPEQQRHAIAERHATAPPK